MRQVLMRQMADRNVPGFDESDGMADRNATGFDKTDGR
jgi:hypothetical protein